MLEDPFVSGVLNGLSKELKKRNYFMMIQEERDIGRVVQYASMWNMAGLVLIGYCQQDYETLRSRMHIPFVVMDSYKKQMRHVSDAGLDNLAGGEVAGRYLWEKGHRRVMYLADNREECDWDRYEGMRRFFRERGVVCGDGDYRLVSCYREQRLKDMERICRADFMGRKGYTAVFCASDLYAIEFMGVLQDQGVKIPEDVSVMGFDGIPAGAVVRPALTTVKQDLEERAGMAVRLLEELMEGGTGRSELVGVALMERESVGSVF